MPLAALLLALSPVAGAAQGCPAHGARVVRAASAAVTPVLDGRLNDAAWAGAEAATDFVQQAPAPGAAASERTEARVLVGADAVYVGVRLHDSVPDSIAAQLGRRDATELYSDWVHVLIDSYHDRRTAFQFSVNPRGVKRDLLRFDDVREDYGWDPVWEVATRQDSAGWTAELRIPLTQLRFRSRPGADAVWGINFGREIARRGEHAFWSCVPSGSGRMVSLAGELRGLPALRSPRRLELLPYTVTRLARAPGSDADPYHEPNDLSASVGADLRYGLTSELSLTATLNPDFGQVEADPALVNLTAFESFFPEKRPFFVEGGDVFRFGSPPGSADAQQLFYTRRIGRAPQRVLRAGAGGWVDAPETTRILGALKLSGRVRGWSVGVMEAVAAPEWARVADSAGTRSRTPVEPLSSYTVARVNRDLAGGRSAVGAILTATHRRIGGDDLEFLRDRAYVGGLDARHRFAGGRLEVRGWVLGSSLHGSPTAISLAQLSPANSFARPDARHLRFDPEKTSQRGWAASAAVQRVAGGAWQWNALASARSPGFDANDLGYQPLADIAFGSAAVKHERFRPGRQLRRWSGGLSGISTWTFGGERIQTQLALTGTAQLSNLWEGGAVLARDFASLSTYELRGGPALRKTPRTTGSLTLGTDRRRAFGGVLAASASYEEGTGASTVSLSPTLSLRPSPRLEMALQPAAAWNRDVLQYVATERSSVGPEYIFGRLHQTTASLAVRSGYTFSPALSLQLYAQPFVSGGDFAGYSRVTDPRAARLAGRFGALGLLPPQTGRYGVDLDADGAADLSFRDPEFNVKQFRGNAVLRWEFRPGSTLFAVWSQARNGRVGDGSFRLDRDVGRLAALPASNVVMIKLTYWFTS